MVRRERTFYSKEFRERVLAVYFGSEESVSMIAQRFEVNLETLNSWIKRYSKRSKVCSFDEVKEQVVKKEKPTQVDLEQRIKHLEKQLEQEQMLVVCLDKMIDIAERELNVNIRKKSGAKQFKK